MGWQYSTFFKIICRFVLFSFYLQSVNPASYGYNPHGFDWPIGFSEAAAETVPPLTKTTKAAQKRPSKAPVIAPKLAANAYLDSTPEANTADPYIIQKATELNHDPAQIFQFVRDEIGNEVYKGSLRGARGTLWSKAGNALDKAALLVALLRVSGIPARYVQGTLTDDLAKQVINSMFKMPLNVVGCPDDSAPRSKPDSDATLLAEAKQHYWVEYNNGSNFQALDTNFTNAKVGNSFVASQSNFNEVPDNLRHKVTVRLKRELYGQFAGILGNDDAQDMKTALEQTFTTVELVGKPLSVGHFVNSSSVGGFGLSATTNTYSPYFLLGQGDSDISDDTIIRGTDYQEVLTKFPLGSTYLSGVFLEFEVFDANGKSQLYERTIADRIGYAARQNGGTSTPTTLASDQTLITDMDIVTANILPGLQNPLTLETQRDRLKKLLDEYNKIKPVVDAIPTDVAPTPEQLKVLNVATLLSRNIATVTGENTGIVFSAASDKALGQLEKGFLTKGYYAAPRIVLSQTKVNSGKFSLAIDLRKNDIRGISFPGQNNEAGFFFNQNRGFIESAIEARTIESLTGLKSTSIIDVFTAPDDPANKISFITSLNSDDLNKLELSNEAKARIATAISEGKSVITHQKPVNVNGTPTTAWFETDWRTGYTISTREDGGHSEFIEYLGLLGSPVHKVLGLFIGTLQGAAVKELENAANILGNLDKVVSVSKGDGLKSLGNTLIGDSLGAAVSGGGLVLKQVKSSQVLNCITSIYSDDFSKPDRSVATIASCFASLAGISGLGAAALGSFVPYFYAGFDLGKEYGFMLYDRNLPSDPPVFPFLSSDLAPVPALVKPNPKPGLSLNIAQDPLFTFPFNGVEIPSVFKAQIRNTGPTQDVFKLAFSNVPAGFKAQSSIPEVSIPAGATAEVGVCVSPTNASVPATGTSIPFTLDVASSSKPSVSASTNQSITIPGIHAVDFSLDSISASTVPGGTVNTTLTLNSVGNVDEQITLKSLVPNGLNLNGLPSTVKIKAGKTKQIPLTVSVDGSVASNQSLDLDITGDVMGSTVPNQLSAKFHVGIFSAGVLPIVQYAADAEKNSNYQLAHVLSRIADLMAQIKTGSCDAVLMNRLAHAYDELLQLDAANPWLTTLKPQIQHLRDLAVACDSKQLPVDAQTFFTSLPPQTNVILPHLSLTPATLELEPDGSGAFVLRLENPNTKVMEVDLQLVSKLPTGVTAKLSNNHVSLTAGEVLDQSSAKAIKVNVKVPPTQMPAFGLEVQATGFASSASPVSVTGLVSVNDALADVLKVTPTPNVLKSGQDTLNASISISNFANSARQLLALLEVVDVGGKVIKTLPAVALSITPSKEPQEATLGSIPVKGLADGIYRLRVSLQTTSGAPLPGTSAEGSFFVGIPVVAEANVAATAVPPGDTEVTTTITVANQLSLNDGKDHASRLIAYHTADAVVAAASSLSQAIGDPQTALGLPNGDFVSLNGGVLVLDLGEGGNLAFDGAGDDLLIIENGNNDSYEVELSLDGVTYSAFGVAKGTRRIDLKGSGLDKARYVKIIDKGDTFGSIPGADIEGVRVLNAQGGVHVERVLFNSEGVSESGGVAPGILNVPIVANLDDDSTPEILYSSDTFKSPHTKRLIAVDGLQGSTQFELNDNIDSSVSVAVAELRPDSPGPEIALSRSNQYLQLLAADGHLLWQVKGGYVSPVIANVDADPEPEIVVFEYTGTKVKALNADGSLAWISGDTNLFLAPSSIVVADLTGDGIGEVIVPTYNRGSIVALQAPAEIGGTASILWETVLAPSKYLEFDNGAAVADVDRDKKPEIIIGDSEGFVDILKHDGQLLKRIKLGAGLISPPSIADVTNDGITDIIVSSGSSDLIYCLSLSAAVLENPDPIVSLKDALQWKAPALDMTISGSGIAVYDLDGDGIWEVIWNGFGSSEAQKDGGLSIFSGKDGRLVYNNPRINSRTATENVTIADIDGDGHAELLAGDQEGLWIIGADDLWVGARDIWNEQSYHINNINADLTVPEHEPPSWLDHNSYRTQRPPTDFIDRLGLKIHHSLPSSSFILDKTSVVPSALNISGTGVDWEAVRRFNDTGNAVFSLKGTVKGLLPGETRPISTGTTVLANYLDANGQRIEIPITLPPLSVTGLHIVSLAPSEQSINAGESVDFTVQLDNPSANAKNYQLAVVGVNDLNPQLLASVSVPPGQSITKTLHLVTPLSTSGDRAFTVSATADGVADTAAGLLHIAAVDTPNPPPQPVALQGLAVDTMLLPSTVSAGQNAAAHYQVMVTNSGSEAAKFNLLGIFPENVSGEFGLTTVDLLPGAAVSVPLILIPKRGLASGAYTFSVKAIAVSDAKVFDLAQGNLNLSAYGVAVGLSPLKSGPESNLQLSVTNIGNRNDSFDLVLAGSAAVVSTLSTKTVSLKPGATQTIPVSVGSLNAVLPGELNLVALATSKTDSNASNSASASITIASRQGVNAILKPEVTQLDKPGNVSLALQIENTGNVEDAYSATITKVTGSATATLTGLDGSQAQSVPLFRLPGLASGNLNLSALISQPGISTVKVRVSSTTDPSIFKDVLAQVNVPIPNKPPIANAGLDNNVFTLSDVILDGSASSDPDGDLITYLWHFVSVPPGSAIKDTDFDNTQAVKPKFKPDLAGVYKINLVVSDGQVSSSADVVMITAAKPNIPPNALAGDDKTVALGKTVTLDGNASNDPDKSPSALSFVWSLKKEPSSGHGLLKDANKSVANFTSDVPGLYTLALQVFDGKDYGNDSMNVTVTYDNVPPVANAGNDFDIHLGETAALNASSSRDPDSAPQPLTYEWSFVSMPLGSHLANTAIVANSKDPAKASFIPEVEGDYIVQVKVSDGNAETTDNVLVKVLPALVVGQPNFLANVINQKTITKGVYKLKVQFTNTGPGTAKNFRITSIKFRKLNGSGTVNLNTALTSSLPLVTPSVDVGASFVVPIVVNVDSGVLRFRLTESGDVADLKSGIYSFSEVQSVIPK